MDRLVLEDSGQQRRCVVCGYTDSLASASSSEPKTRLAGGLQKPPSNPEDVRPVRIVEPAQKQPGKGAKAD